MQSKEEELKVWENFVKKVEVGGYVDAAIKGVDECVRRNIEDDAFYSMYSTIQRNNKELERLTRAERENDRLKEVAEARLARIQELEYFILKNNKGGDICEK